MAKYAEASRVSVALSEGDGVLRFQVSEDGRGFDPRDARGTGQGMIDRPDAIGGEVTVTSSPGHGTTVVGRPPAQPVWLAR